MIITRRQFLKMVTASAAALGLSQTDLLKLEKALALPQTGCLSPTPSVIWMAGQACSGCQTSLLNRVVDVSSDTGTDPKDIGLPGNYYDRDMLSALYGVGGPNPVPSDVAELNVVNDIADLLVGDAVGTLVPAITPRDLTWAAFNGGYVTLEWLSTVMASAGDIPVQHLVNIRNAGGFVLMVDGSIPTGDATKEKYCYVFDNEVNDGVGGTPIVPVGPGPDQLPNVGSITMAAAMKWLARKAAAVISVGTCSSYGGIPAARRSQTGAMSVKAFLTANSITKPVIDVPGCPPHPDWIVYPVAYYLIHSAVCPLDRKGRPAATYGELPLCTKCPNEKKRLETGKVANFLGDSGCVGPLGCKGPITFGDCPIRQKNVYDDGTMNNWCVGAQGETPTSPAGHFITHGIGEARHPCQGCIESDFPDGKSPFYVPSKGTIFNP